MSQGHIMDSENLRKIIIKLFKGESLRACAKEAGCSPATIHSFKVRLKKSSLTLDQVNSLNDADLLASLYEADIVVKNHKINRVIVKRTVSHDPDHKTDQLRPDFKTIAKKLLDSKRTVQLFWRDYMDDCIKQGKYPVSRSYFYKRVNAETAAIQPIERKVKMYQSHPYGKEVMMDFTGSFWPLYNSNGELISKLPILVLTWPASGYVKAQVLINATTGVVCTGIGRLLTIVGVQPDLLTIDNFKAAVNKHAKGKEAIFNDSFFYYFRQIGLDVQVNNPRSPTEKSAVESGVGLVQRRCLPRLEGKYFESLEQCNIALNAAVDKYINEEGYKNNGTGTPRKELFILYEVPACKPVTSPMPQYFKHFMSLRVSEFYLIEIDERKYSVPFKYVGKYVDAQINDRDVVIMFKGKTIARHPINLSPTEPLISEEHMPEHHQAVREKKLKYENPEQILDEAKRWSPYVYKYCKGILDSKGIEGKKGCIAIINQCKRSSEAERALIYEALRAVTDEESKTWNFYRFNQKFNELKAYSASHEGKFPHQTAINFKQNSTNALLRGSEGFKDADQPNIDELGKNLGSKGK